MGKDVTLHVSASNPAMMLYQKFGFKAEQFIVGFYDKYFAAESNECRNAFFLRLQRWAAILKYRAMLRPTANSLGAVRMKQQQWC